MQFDYVNKNLYRPDKILKKKNTDTVNFLKDLRFGEKRISPGEVLTQKIPFIVNENVSPIKNSYYEGVIHNIMVKQSAKKSEQIDHPTLDLAEIIGCLNGYARIIEYTNTNISEDDQVNLMPQNNNLVSISEG